MSRINHLNASSRLILGINCGILYAMEPLNKGHVGDNNIDSLVLSFIEKLSSTQRFSMYRESNFWDLEQCPLQRGFLYCVPILEGSFTLDAILHDQEAN